MSQPAATLEPRAVADAVADASLALCATVIVAGEIPACAADLRPDDLPVATHSELWTLFRELTSRDDAISPEALATLAAQRGVTMRLPEGGAAGWAVQLAADHAVPVLRLNHAVAIVRADAARRRLRRAATDAACAADAGRPVEEIAEGLARAAEHARRATAQPGDIPPPAFELAKTLWNEPIPPAVPTGLPSLDDLLAGGARGVTLLAAPTGKGKTGFAIQMVRTVSLRQLVLYVSTELSRRQVIARFAAPALGSWRGIFEAGPEAGPAIAKAISCFDLRVVQCSDVQELASLLRRIAASAKRTPFLVVDYLQGFIRGADVDRRLAVGALSDVLTCWSRDTGAAALVVSSVARSMYAGNADKSAGDFVGAAKESGDLEFDAANVLFLDVDPCPMGGTSSGRLHVAKSRFGVQGTVGLLFDGARGTFTEDPAGGLSEDQGAIYEAIKAGAKTWDSIAEAVGIQRQKIGPALKALQARNLIGSKPIRVLP